MTPSLYFSLVVLIVGVFYTGVEWGRGNEIRAYCVLLITQVVILVTWLIEQVIG